MTDYEVSFKGHPNSTMRVEADNPQQAMDNFLKISGNPLSSEVSVNEWNENSSHRAHTTSTKEDNSSTLEDSSVTLLSHRDSLRNDTAYPVLRMVNLLNSACIVLISFLWGTQIGEGAVAISVIIGVVVAILSYSISSVFFDLADSNINTSKNSKRS
jgi:hypothetical protein